MPYEDSRRCPHCAAPLVPGGLDCRACGQRLVPTAVAQRAQVLSEELVAHVEGSPYFREVGRLGYTLRGKVQGFLSDPGHPLARDLLHYLWQLEQLGRETPAASRPLRERALRVWIQPAAPLLTPALEFLHDRHAGALAAAQDRGGFEAWYATLLDVAEGP